ncbi:MULTISPECIES: hypothetical protein [unclassified Methylobacterium]|uniref:hypothetical protein n=1 Tax=unclassified Methylobacterium TaxID=2615210 RepID=UPI001114F707|nr:MULTISPECIES: hypothetical protein [unclassified Methylobacterium]
MAWPVDPQNLDDLNKVRALMASAERLKVQDLVTACIRRISELEGRQFADPIERRFWEIISVFEELLTKENGRTSRASRTREKVKRVGVVQTLNDLAASSQPSGGFHRLVDAGLSDYLFEYLILENPERFTPQAVGKASKRLTAHKLPLRRAA